MEKYELQKLRDLPIEGVAERLGLRVVRHKCLCPFHDDHHASMSFKVSKNTFRCFVCGESGGPIDLVMKYLRKDFLDATKWLTEGAALVITSYRYNDITPKEGPPFDPSRYARFFERPWLSPEARKFLFDERKLDPRVVRWCRLTSWRDKHGVPWLQTPYYDREYKLIGIQNRNLVKGATPRFRFPQGAECGIYNLPVLNLLKPGETLYITEGCSDCWAMLSSGHKAIAIPSATLLSKKDKELLETWNLKLETKFAMYPDNDVPGERLFLQLKEVLPNLEHHQLPAGCKDYSEYYLKLGVRN
ncbi:MAG: hypothetical protein J5720_02035 [Bacteroidaceae bacterium]|nr:hypothetical protein [Bacteroidaceae bacterium]